MGVDALDLPNIVRFWATPFVPHVTEPRRTLVITTGGFAQGEGRQLLPPFRADASLPWAFASFTSLQTQNWPLVVVTISPSNASLCESEHSPSLTCSTCWHDGERPAGLHHLRLAFGRWSSCSYVTTLPECLNRTGMNLVFGQSVCCAGCGADAFGFAQHLRRHFAVRRLVLVHVGSGICGFASRNVFTMSWPTDGPLWSFHPKQTASVALYKQSAVFEDEAIFTAWPIATLTRSR